MMDKHTHLRTHDLTGSYTEFVHPGIILQEEFIRPYGLSQAQLSEMLAHV